MKMQAYDYTQGLCHIEDLCLIEGFVGKSLQLTRDEKYMLDVFAELNGIKIYAANCVIYDNVSLHNDGMIDKRGIFQCSIYSKDQLYPGTISYSYATFVNKEHLDSTICNPFSYSTFMSSVDDYIKAICNGGYFVKYQYHMSYDYSQNMQCKCSFEEVLLKYDMMRFARD